MPRPRRRELSLQKRIVAHVNACGGRARIIAQTEYTTAGDPDILGVFLGQFFTVEAKEDGEQATPIQRFRLREWADSGALVGVVRSVADAEAIISGFPVCPECFNLNRSSRGPRCAVCRNSKRRKAAHELIRRHKRKPCADCRKRYPYYVMSFDHVGRKDFNIAQMARRVSLEALEKEIRRCEVVCMNCHQIRTFRRLTS